MTDRASRENEINQQRANSSVVSGSVPDFLSQASTSPQNEATRVGSSRSLSQSSSSPQNEGVSSLVNSVGIGRHRNDQHIQKLANIHENVKKATKKLNSMVSQREPLEETENQVNDLKKQIEDLKNQFMASHEKLGNDEASHGTTDDLSTQIEKAVDSAEESINNHENYKKTGETKPKKSILSKITGFFGGSSSDKSSDSDKSSGGGGSSGKNKKLKYMAAYAFICIIVFTLTYFIISDSAFTTKSGLSEKKVKDNLKNKAVKKQIDLGIYWGMGLILLWILMVSIHLGE